MAFLSGTGWSRKPGRSFLPGILVPLLAPVLGVVCWGDGRATAGLPVLRSVKHLRALSLEEAKRGYPVHLRGIVTYSDAVHGDLFVQDATGAVFVDRALSDRDFRPGEVLDVQGVTKPADFATDITNVKMRVVAERRVPAARKVSAEELASGTLDCLRVEVDGVVRSAESYQGGWMLDIVAGAVQFKAYIPGLTFLPTDLVDARVRIRGTCGGFYNRRAQFIALEVLVPKIEDIVVVERPPRNYFALPVSPVRAILRAAPNRAFLHRVRVQGVVTLQRPGRSLFIRGDDVGLLVKTRQNTPLRVGDRVDVAGFPALDEFGPILQDAVFQQIGAGNVPTPPSVTADQATEGSYDAELVRISARLVDHSLRQGQYSLVLGAGTTTFVAEMDEALRWPGFAELENGALLQLTGVCSVQVNENRDPNGFVIHLRSPQDVVLERRPSWWTAQHAALVVAATGAVILVVLGWVAALRRRVGRQTEMIRRRLESEAALQQRFEYVVRATNDAVWDVDLTTNALWCGERFYTTFGYQPQEIEFTASWWVDRVHAHDRDRVFRNINAAIESGDEHWSSDYRFRRADGSYANVYDRGYILRDPAGKPLRMIGALMDISTLKRTEEALREAQDRFTAFMDHSPTFAFLKDSSGRYVYANRPFEALLETKIEGKTAFDWMTPEAAAEYREHDLAVLSTGKAAEFIELIPTPHGASRDLLIFKFPVDASGQRFIGAVAVDITERKRAERELQTAKEAAEAANRTKSEFLANMSHEIRTPMNGILGMTELVLGTELTPEQRDYLAAVKSSADALLILINDILDFSKIEAGKLELEVMDFDIRNNLEPTLKALAVRAHEKPLDVNCHIAPEVPKILVGDPGRLRQVVINLVGNAVKFTERGEVTLCVEQESREGDKVCLHFSISDTGIGISPDKQSAIFEAFTQADGSTARRYGGTGLGLTISRRLVELMGGRIWLDSETGHGSTFHFLASFGVGKPAAGSELVRQPNLCGIPVMVVDDNATNRRILGDMLRQWQMAPVLAESGREALIELEEAAERGRPFGLVLTDASMPDMDGLELVKQIRQRPHLGHVKIIVLTSAGRWCDSGCCPGLGLETCLSKPVGQSELRNAIVGAVGASGATAGRGGPGRCPVKHRTRNLRILLAEDNLVNQKLARRLLEKQGHEVAIAENGREALAAIEKDGFELVLMDVQMPEMDGFVATQVIREREAGTGRHLPIIAMTAHAMKGDEERCLEAGMDGYVSKPINAAELLAVIEEAASLSVV